MSSAIVLDSVTEGDSVLLASSTLEALSRVIEVDSSLRRRVEYSSDASNYRVQPAVVAFPRSVEEVEAALGVARSAGLPVTSRGGGTSVAGNAIGPGLVLDFSRYMNRVLEIDPVARTARVEPGVIMSDLQEAAAPYGLWFGPDPSTKNRATLGGMIGNNACGPHALTYGRTSDNTVSLDVIDGRGRRFVVGSGPGELEKVAGLSELVSTHLALLRTELGRFTRQESGYSLEHLLPEKGGDLAKALVGTEGTCVTVVEATVALKPVPTKPTLVVLGYPSMIAAAGDVINLLPQKPLALEGMDSRLVEVVRRAVGSVPELPGGEGWLFCEVGEVKGDGRSAAQRAADLVAASASVSHRIVTDPQETAALWRIRADGVGLAGRTPAGNQAWPGWEDAAVPPAHLGPYLSDFEDLMSKYGIEGLPYGHFGDGCIHVRMDVPLDSEGDVPVFKAFMEEAAALVGRYGGSISGEHGDGRARGALLPHMYSSEAISLFEQFKGLFDPDNLLNPGVLVDPAPITSALRRPQAKPIAGQGFAFAHDRGDFTSAVHRCVGVGKCRADNSAAGGFMCPSYRATKDEKDVTRGRARVLQDLTRGALPGGWDSPAVAEALDLCLSCKACGRDCPAGVDMSMYKSEVTYRRYRGKLRPMNHYVLGWLPRWARLVTAVPTVAGLANAALQIDPLRRLVFKVSGMDPRREMTAFTRRRFSRWFKGRPSSSSSSSNKQAVKRDVIIWADSFSEYLDPTSATAMVELLQQAGYTVRIPSASACCGLTWISTGQLDGAKRHLGRLLDILGPAAQKGVPIIGVEPSCTAVLRSDLQELLPDDPRSAPVGKMTMTLAELLSDPDLGPDPQWFADHSLEGVRVVAQPHCHQHAVMGYEKDLELLRRLGATVTPVAGCCGLAGNFGMEKGHYEVSVAVANNELLPALAEAKPGSVFLADGYSCRTQASQLADVIGVGLPTLLLGRQK
ncbi:FAD-binding and (Fe-S)-binding domain-containing protein [Actinomyces minihominis]|uniref:FAD-binding and (Fe-S)-binding domain-containing protein n=1 Tax=Actinomyces minihominis TaxID=2002838 RepID=UPI000C07B169|nr:FAD-binding and (Fe-S)-binding domain-containing protein [Actinomyces minihominis]